MIYLDADIEAVARALAARGGHDPDIIVHGVVTLDGNPLSVPGPNGPLFVIPTDGGRPLWEFYRDMAIVALDAMSAHRDG